MNIVCVGDCGVDHYLPSGDQFFGGITANFARHASNAFPPDDCIAIVSAIGDDAGADLVLDSLQDSSIECHIVRLAGATPVQYIEIRPDGEKEFVRYDEGVLADFRIGSKAKQLIETSDLLVIPVYLQIVGLFDDLMTITRPGLTSVDFADFVQHPNFDLLERYIAHIDVGFFGLDLSDSDTISRVGQLAQNYDKLFVVTLGAAGSRAYAGSKRYDCAAVTVDCIVDTTGAGDAFAAAFLSRHLHGSSIEEALEAGAGLASRVIQQTGSVPTIP